MSAGVAGTGRLEALEGAEHTLQVLLRNSWTVVIDMNAGDGSVQLTADVNLHSVSLGIFDEVANGAAHR